MRGLNNVSSGSATSADTLTNACQDSDADRGNFAWVSQHLAGKTKGVDVKKLDEKRAAAQAALAVDKPEGTNNLLAHEGTGKGDGVVLGLHSKEGIPTRAQCPSA